MTSSEVAVACGVCGRPARDHWGAMPGKVWVGHGVGRVPCEEANEAERLALVGEREVAIQSDLDAPPRSGPGWLACVHALALEAGGDDVAWPGASGHVGATLAGRIAGDTERYTEGASVISYLQAAYELLGLASGAARSRPSAATIDAIHDAMVSTGRAIRRARAGGES